MDLKNLSQSISRRTLRLGGEKLLSLRLCFGFSLPAMEPAHVGQIALYLSSFRDQFRGDRYGNFFRSNRSNIQSDGRMDSVEEMRGQSFRLQLFENSDCLSFRSDHSDVTRWSLHRPAQHSHIVAMAARDDHDVRRLGGRKLRCRLLEILCDHLLCLGEP